jgi:CHAD domain-containing protein
LKETNPLLESLEKHWKQFVSAWDSTGRTPDVKSIHDLRVAARRLSASLTLVQSVDEDRSIARVRHRFKKLQKRLGTIRDTQVRLLLVASTNLPEVLKFFQQSLKRIEY